MEPGALVWARDANGDYFKAQIKARFDDGTGGHEYEVHYVGWSANFDETVPDDGVKRLSKARPPSEDAPELNWCSNVGLLDHDDMQYEVEKLVRKRKRTDGRGDEYLVHWKGWSRNYNSWEPAENISEELISAFVPPTHPTRGDFHGPYSLSVEDPLPADQAASVVKPWLLTVGRKAAKLLDRQQEAWAYKMLEKMDTCPAWIFKAIHACLKEMATTLNSEDEHISAISASKGGFGGIYVEDKFVVKSSKLVELLVAPHNKQGYGCLSFTSKKVAVMLVPPLEFSYRTKRVGEGAEPEQQELVVTGHFMQLLPRDGAKNTPRWVFDEDRAEYTDTNKHAYKVACAKAAAAVGRDKFSPKVLKFLSLLQ